MRKAALLTLLVSSVGFAGGPSVSGGGFPSTGLILVNGTCPSGWTQDNSAQGRYIVGLAASGNPGDTIGSAMATTTTDATITATSSAPTISCTTSPNFVTTAGSTPACDDSPAPTASAPTITVGSTADQRAEIAPHVALRLCKKS